MSVRLCDYTDCGAHDILDVQLGLHAVALMLGIAVERVHGVIDADLVILDVPVTTKRHG